MRLDIEERVQIRMIVRYSNNFSVIVTVRMHSYLAHDAKLGLSRF